MNLIRALATCFECGWELESNNAMGVAARHHKKYGHEVHVELTYIQIFGYKSERAKGALLKNESDET